jgi:hypothetical protein
MDEVFLGGYPRDRVKIVSSSTTHISIYSLLVTIPNYLHVSSWPDKSTRRQASDLSLFIPSSGEDTLVRLYSHTQLLAPKVCIIRVASGRIDEVCIACGWLHCCWHADKPKDDVDVATVMVIWPPIIPKAQPGLVHRSDLATGDTRTPCGKMLESSRDPEAYLFSAQPTTYALPLGPLTTTRVVQHTAARFRGILPDGTLF